jgi:hypothetical protein
MTETLQYEDFVLRIMQIAAEHKALPDGAVVSLPVCINDQSQKENIKSSLFAFMYTLGDKEEEFERDEDDGDDNEDIENPKILHPYARVQLRLDGELVKWGLHRKYLEQSVVGKRFSDIAADMRPDEQLAFMETYYELLTSEEGPLRRPWSGIEPAVLHDLRELFYAMVEAPFLPLYRQFAGEFLNFIGTP